MMKCADFRYFPKDKLQLKQDVPGAKMWAVALDKAMLTYFEVEPNSQFYMHKHQSEQITLVLEGTLFFEMSDKTVSVKEGEVIAIASNIKHAVFTKEDFVRAVDAWSPVRKEYKDKM
jgi:quercetin dioxygenase-like cupin family protein